MPSEWIERQIDEALFATATTAGILYTRRRIRRALPKVMIGGAVVVALGAAATAAVVGVGVLGAAGGATAWYRHRSKAVAPANGWKAPPASFASNSGAGVADAARGTAAE